MTTATRWRCSTSSADSARPRRTGIPAVSNSCSLAKVTSAIDCDGTADPGTSNGLEYPPNGGVALVSATAETPGMEPIRSTAVR